MFANNVLQQYNMFYKCFVNYVIYITYRLDNVIYITMYLQSWCWTKNSDGMQD